MSDQVLVIDDEQLIVDGTVAALQLRGISARGESNTEAAIESFKANPTDVVIVDYRLSPDVTAMTGVDVIAALQAFKPYTQFILISGWIDENLNEDTLTEELRKTLLANKYIQKPVKPGQLVAAVQDALQGMDGESEDWQAIAGRYTAHETTTPEQVRAVNEKIKEHLIKAVDEAHTDAN